MKVKKKNIFNFLILMSLVVYLIITINVNTIMIDAMLTLLFALVLTIKSKSNNLIYIFSFFIFYCIYSIVVGEYFTMGALGTAIAQVKTAAIYGETIRIVLVFITTLSLFVPKVKEKDIEMPYRDNSFIFYTLYLILMIIGLFGVDRTMSSSYEVNISAAYEYSTILFLFAYYSSGNRKYKKIFLSLLLGVFILQDIYYGGRITSLQLAIVFISCMLNEKINTRNITVGAFLGLILANVVGSYRTSYSLAGISIVGILKNMYDSLFVFDTATHSYYASATHVASIVNGNVNFSTRLDSFFSFLKSIFIGSGETIGNVTRFVSDNYYVNVGGGLFPTHFYFWLGWIGVILSSIILVKYIKINLTNNTEQSKLALILLISTSPRWLLYNPLTLFRVQFILIVLFLIYKLGHNSLLRIAGKKRAIDII